MIVEPLSVPIAECWEVNYPEVVEYNNARFFQENAQMAQVFMQNEENKKWINLYLFRSYKMVQTLAVPYNLKFVLSHSENFLDEFFRSLEAELQQVGEQEKLYDIEVLADLIVAIVRLEPYAGYNYLLFYNVPFLFARFLHKPKVFDLLTALVVPSNLIFETTEDMANKYWNYYKQSDFFPDLFSVVYSGTKIEAYKFRSTYKPIAIPEMSKLMVGGSIPEKMKLRNFSSATRTAIQTTTGLMVEDQKFISADIDLVRKYLKEIKAKMNASIDAKPVSENLKASQRGRQLVKTSTLEIMPNEDSIIQSMKAKVPITANYSLKFTSPEKLALIEPFAVKKTDNHDVSRFRKESSRTIKTNGSRQSRLSIL